MDLAVRLHLNQIWVVWRLCGTGGGSFDIPVPTVDAKSHGSLCSYFGYFAERNDWQLQSDAKCGHHKYEP